jgi:hypothetical protein
VTINDSPTAFFDSVSFSSHYGVFIRNIDDFLFTKLFGVALFFDFIGGDPLAFSGFPTSFNEG